MRLKMKWAGRGLIALWFIATGCHAFMLGGTRVVLSQDEGSATLPVISGKNDPLSLIRSKITRTPESEVSVTNFMITPPLFRLEPGGRNQLRISLVNPQNMPVDRESLFYLKVAGIPSSNPLARNSRVGFSGATLLVGTGNIIKLLYRPHGIPRPGNGVWSTLKYTRVPGGVQVSNPTPWNVSLASLVIDGQRVHFSSRQPSIIPPFEKQVYGTRSTLKKQVSWSVLDDSGNAVAGTTPIE